MHTCVIIHADQVQRSEEAELHWQNQAENLLLHHFYKDGTCCFLNREQLLSFLQANKALLQKAVHMYHSHCHFLYRESCFSVIFVCYNSGCNDWFSIFWFSNGSKILFQFLQNRFHAVQYRDSCAANQWMKRNVKNCCREIIPFLKRQNRDSCYQVNFFTIG